MLGKETAFRSFRDVLAQEMEKALPELRDDVRAVVEVTGGSSKEENGSVERAEAMRTEVQVKMEE